MRFSRTPATVSVFDKGASTVKHVAVMIKVGVKCMGMHYVTEGLSLV